MIEIILPWLRENSFNELEEKGKAKKKRLKSCRIYIKWMLQQVSDTGSLKPEHTHKGWKC